MGALYHGLPMALSDIVPSMSPGGGGGPQPPHAIQVLGVRVHDVTEAEAVAIIEGFIQGGGPHRVVTPNPEIVMRARREPDLRAILNSSDLSIPDGAGLLAAARLAGTPLREHVWGTDLVLRLAERSPSRGWRWFLLGAQPGVAAAAGERLQARYPGLQVAGTLAGSPGPEGDMEAWLAISAAGPVHVLLVAYGGGLQERWIARNQARVGVPVQIGVGGVLDYLAERVQRAPEWARRLELEWAYRLVREPWRWRRQLALPAFTALAAAETLRKRRRGGPQPP